MLPSMLIIQCSLLFFHLILNNIFSLLVIKMFVIRITIVLENDFTKISGSSVYYTRTIFKKLLKMSMD